MSNRAMSLKGKIKNIAKSKSILAQVVLQNFMFECFLERVSLSKYKDKFILKGGMLIAAMVGIDNRSTMDLDTTLRNYQLNQESIVKAITEICAIKTDDDINFNLKKTELIRKDDVYGGIRVNIEGRYDTIIAPMSIDVSTGDVITPNPVKYKFIGMFDEEKEIELWAYNIETVLAEKVETILRRGVFNTRARDFYDIYILCTSQKYNIDMFKEAFKATVQHRGSSMILSNIDEIIDVIASDYSLSEMWKGYSKEYKYAEEIGYNDVIKAIMELTKDL